MRVSLFLCVSVALLYTAVFCDHHGKDHRKNRGPDHDHSHNHDHDQDHDHGQKGHQHGFHNHPHTKGKHQHRHHHKHHQSNHSLECHKIAPSNAEFAFHLYRQVASEQPSKNVFLSPVSISTAFALLSLGARANTYDQIIEGLGFNTTEISEQQIIDGFQHLIHVLNDPDSELQLNSGNALFISKEKKLLDKFLEDAKNYFDSEAFSTDFQKSEEAKTQINSYVEKKTNGKIVDLLSSVDQATALVIINYIYFRGKWENPFREENTQEGDFHVDENTVVKVPMMYRNGYYRWAYDKELGCTVVQIPYKGNASAWFILPDQGKLKQVEESLQRQTLKSWKKSLSGSRIDLYLPKFSISTTLDLKSELAKLGVTDVFSEQADLSGITGEPNVKVGKAVHKAFLNVDERGTEAAGATALEIVPMMLPPKLSFDRPFLLVITCDISKSLLFMGKLVNPTA
ncbi:alpha-1-antitrypsin-like [Discoglossus pictus]